MRKYVYIAVYFQMIQILPKIFPLTRMKHTSVMYYIPLLYVFIALLSGHIYSTAAVQIVPQPVSVQSGSFQLGLNPSQFKIYSNSDSAILSRAIQRSYQSLFPFKASDGGQYNVKISVKSSNEDLCLGVDESYTLNLQFGQGIIDAQTIWGAMWGLQTLTQLVTYNNSYWLSEMPISISDSPRYPWRGLLIDTSRHFLEVDAIYRQIDALSYTKMNVLHWHAVDAQSFPIVSKAFPSLTLGAYAPEAVYDHETISAIVQYAKDRGVRVVAEFDVPGHAASWGVGDPSLTVKCPRYSANVNNIPLNPAHEHTFDVVQGLFAEMVGLFPDAFFHIGGDEVVFGCWYNNTDVMNWMHRMGFTNGVQVEGYFIDRIQKFLESTNKTTIVWEDLFDEGVTLDPSTIIHVWKDQSVLNEAISQGYSALISAGWYLGVQVPKEGTIHGLYYDTWQDFYQNDPLNGVTAPKHKQKLILGGEAAMWGEQCDSDTLDQQVWPRTAATGERLWSPQSVTDLVSAKIRLNAFSCYLKQRGIKSTPLMPDYCRLPKK